MSLVQPTEFGASLLTAVLVSTIAFGFSLFWARARNTHLKFWALGYAVAVIGHLLPSLSGTSAIQGAAILQWAEIVLLVISQALFLKGTCAFFARKLPIRAVLSTISFFAVSGLIVIFIEWQTKVIMTFLLTLSVSASVTAQAWRIHREINQTRAWAMQMPVAFMGAIAISMLALAILSGKTLASGGVETGMPPAQFVMIVLIVFYVGSAFCFLGMQTDRTLDHLAIMARTDSLSGLYNRRAFEEWMNGEFNRAKRANADLSLFMIDIDHFKRINDTHGHAVGDQGILHMGKMLKGVLRPYDLAARYGGEEFCVALPNTGLYDAHDIAERLRALEHRFAYDDEGRPLILTLSIGVATLQLDDLDWEQVVQRADAALYEAKNNGRDRVEVYVHEITPMTAAVAI